jgi:hypothetical protein
MQLKTKQNLRNEVKKMRDEIKRKITWKTDMKM